MYVGYIYECDDDEKGFYYHKGNYYADCLYKEMYSKKDISDYYRSLTPKIDVDYLGYMYSKENGIHICEYVVCWTNSLCAVIRGTGSTQKLAYDNCQQNMSVLKACLQRK